jgi:hypothetical protein
VALAQRIYRLQGLRRRLDGTTTYAFAQIDDVGEAKKVGLNGSRQPAALLSAKPGTPDTMAATCEIYSMVTRSCHFVHHSTKSAPNRTSAISSDVVSASGACTSRIVSASEAHTMNSIS